MGLRAKDAFRPRQGDSAIGERRCEILQAKFGCCAANRLKPFSVLQGLLRSTFKDKRPAPEPAAGDSLAGSERDAVLQSRRGGQLADCTQGSLRGLCEHVGSGAAE